ncbi:uncharacterized protein LOC103580158 [Microplitis demolitor]|uniref:uncharacterized protein LOC103580158 n=1 Tax=Microplitis demolitor TaxID=69319 RepID=UPI0004CDDBE7|nr:uncharacterized protein LOC103580158 [Microplitis demolitor]
MFVYLIALCFISGGLGKPAEVLLEYQDSLGQYSFGYSAPGSARSEVGSADGSTRGAFSYVDGSGVVQTAKYTADGENGFRIEASNLPVAPSPVEETPEVQAARLEHFRAHEAAKQNLIAVEGQKNEPAKDKAGDAGVKMIKDDKKEEIKKEKKENKDKENSLLLMKLKGISEKEDKIPVVTSSFVMPASNLNLQNRIELRGAAGFSGTAPSDWMHQGEAKANEYFKASPQLQLQTSAASQSQFYRGSPIVQYSSFGYPIYYNHHVQYVPSFYYY